MSTLPALLMILSGSIHAIVNAMIKGGGDKAAARAATDATSALLMLPALAVVAMPAGAWGLLATSAVIHAFYLHALVRAYEVGDFSAAYPVLRGVAPLATAAVSVGLLGEPASAADLVGVALIGGSMVALVAGRHLSRSALGWSLLTGVAIAGYTVVDATGVRAAPSPWSYIAWNFATMGWLTTLMFVALRGRALVRGMRDQWRPGVVAGALSIVTYGMALTAFSMGPTAPLAALRETGMVTAVLIGAVVLKERVTPARAAAVAGVMAGAALILAF
jgi:drug/metabolite transporter (DMT)-like permease